jgi:hypothetical protein
MRFVKKKNGMFFNLAGVVAETGSVAEAKPPEDVFEKYLKARESFINAVKKLFNARKMLTEMTESFAMLWLRDLSELSPELSKRMTYEDIVDSLKHDARKMMSEIQDILDILYDARSDLQKFMEILGERA